MGCSGCLARHSIGDHKLWVLSFLLLLPLGHGQQAVPGLDAWQAAIQQHAEAEGKVGPQKEGKVPGLASWESHQKAILEAEKKLENSGGGKEIKAKSVSTSSVKSLKQNQEEKNSKPSSKKSGVAGGFTDVVKSSINKLLAKLSGKDTSKASAGTQLKSEVESLLEKSRDTKIEQGAREYSFLDKLIDSYSKEDRESSLRSVGQERDVLFKGKYKNRYSNTNRDRQRALRQNRYRERFSLLYDYDYQRPRPQRRKPNYLRILNGEYLDLISDYDDDYEDDY